MPLRIGLVGSAVSRVLAPYGDFGWTLYGVGTSPTPRPVAGWLEVHDVARSRLFTPAYRRLLRDAGVVLCADVDVCREFAGRMLPVGCLEDRFGSEMLSSSVAIGLAYAIHMRASSIGLWGIEQSRKAIYRYQRPGTLYFLRLARELGIEVVMPDGCPLLDEAPRYPLPGYWGQEAERELV